MNKEAYQHKNHIDNERYNEFKLLGLFPEGFDTIEVPNRKLKYFSNYVEYSQAIHKAMDFLSEYKPVPEPLRTKLIKEAANLRKKG